MTDQYEYMPLAEQQIRLLTIFPGSFDDDLHLNLTPVTLLEDQPPEYHALSYAWGSTERCETVHIVTSEGQHPLPVTQNLHSALKHLRHTTQISTLWADAICINQDDVKERSAQVARMAAVFQTATKVVIWLGLEADGSTGAIRTLSAIGSVINVDWNRFAITQADTKHADSDLLDFSKRWSFNIDTWISLSRLLTRGWFERLWIWQEVFLARCAGILCGQEWLNWECFRKAILLLGQRPVHRYLFDSLPRAVEFVYTHKQDSLVKVMERTKYAQCSDARDRIYGILHLLLDSERLGIQPDYTKTTVEVYRDLVIRTSSQLRHLSLLRCCELSGEPTQLPSWVPNWSLPRKCTSLSQASACWNSKSYARYQDGGLFTVTGCYAAKVRRVVPVLDRTSDPEWQITEPDLYTALVRLLLTIRDDGSMDLGQEAEAVCRTLVCDALADVYEPIQTNELDFQKAIKCFHALMDKTTKALEDVWIDFRQLLHAFHEECFGRAFIFTEQGHIGLAPERCQPNDIVVVVLGCQAPMVLRPTNTAEYLVVGECYMHGMMTGELFLGSLPKNWQRVSRYAEEKEKLYDAFIDREKGIWQARDPRLGPLPEGWVELEHPKQHLHAYFRDEVEKSITHFDPRMQPSYLRDRGVCLQEFNLL
ncbi:MAG: hypothetical protein Q9212_006321 [Teloschistes hypoglaucus]